MTGQAEIHFDAEPECPGFDACQVAMCGCRWLYTGLPWAEDKSDDRDLDNLLKGLLDSISAAGVIVDDCQVDEIQMRREGVHKGGKVQVWVWAIA